MTDANDFDSPPPAERSGLLTEATCWECGEAKVCYEYVVCCTGTLFHVCPECVQEKETQAADESPTSCARQVTGDGNTPI